MAQVYTAFPPPANMGMEGEEEDKPPVHTFNSTQSILYICIGVAAFISLIIGSIYGYLKWKKRRAPLDYSWRSRLPPSEGRPPPTENFLNTLARVDVQFGLQRAALLEARRLAEEVSADASGLPGSAPDPAARRNKPLPPLPDSRQKSLPALAMSDSMAVPPQSPTPRTAQPRPPTPLRESPPGNLRLPHSSFRV